MVSGTTRPGQDLPVSGFFFHKWKNNHSVQIESFIYFIFIFISINKYIVQLSKLLSLKARHKKKVFLLKI
jgi:hypothetical protein